MEDGARRRRPRYIDEDTSPTTERELRGWYSYAIAAEVFAISGTGSFLPVTMEQLARERGVLKSDGVTSCVAPNAAGRVLRSLLTRADETSSDAACVVNILGGQINTSSFALYTFSLAVGVQALVLISISAIADHGNYRKRFLLTFAWTGATACMLFIFISPSVYLLAPILVVISMCCLGNGFALLNSFLPLLVANSPATPDTGGDQWQPVSASEENERTASHGLHLSNKISAKGIGLGYAAGLFVQLLAIAILIIMSKLQLTNSATLPMRVVLLVVGAWWATFTIPTYLWLRPRPGPRLQSVPITTRRWLQPFHYVAFAWRSLFATVKTAIRLRQIIIFLAAWFLMSDAIATVSGVAILFAKTELHMDTPAIALVSITATVSGILGATLWPMVQKRLGLETNRVIMACICLFEVIPLYGLLGFITPVLGLRHAWEIFPMAVIHGFVMGGLSSFCRSFYGLLIPPGSEAAFYALYAVTDKGSSVIGPAVVGRIVDKTGSVRMGFWFLAVLIVAPLPLVWMVNADKGRSDALAIAGAKEGGHEGESVPLAEGVGRTSTDEDGDEAFGLMDSDDELDYLPNR